MVSEAEEILPITGWDGVECRKERWETRRRPSAYIQKFIVAFRGRGGRGPVTQTYCLSADGMDRMVPAIGDRTSVEWRAAFRLLTTAVLSRSIGERPTVGSCLWGIKLTGGGSPESADRLPLPWDLGQSTDLMQQDTNFRSWEFPKPRFLMKADSEFGGRLMIVSFGL